MSDFFPNPPRRLSLEQLRKQSKELLRAYDSGDIAARARFAEANSGRIASTLHPRITLADAQFVIARESGFATWTELKRSLERIIGLDAQYDRLVANLISSWAGDDEALQQIDSFVEAGGNAERLKQEVARRTGSSLDSPLPQDQARLFVARTYGFEDWPALLAASFESAKVLNHGLSSSPPFYRLLADRNSIEPLSALSLAEWGRVFDAMKANRITGIQTKFMTDAVLDEVCKLDFVSTLHLEGSRNVTDLGLKNLGDLPNLEILNLTGCDITDNGLEVLSRTGQLREFYLYHHPRVTDAGCSHLRCCEKIERVDTLGCQTGDGLIASLAGRTHFRHFKSGDLVTDQGMGLLHEVPAFKDWAGGKAEMSLMSFDAGPTYLLLRGEITDSGLAKLRGLNGVSALNLDDSRLRISSQGIGHLEGLENLSWLGFDATDESMPAIAELPGLRMLMCQDTRCSDLGFGALSRSKTLQYLWGRRCYGLTGEGFRALAHITGLRGLSVSCKNVDDESLATLPSFPCLREFMPMDFTDRGFLHVGRCEELESLWCMYCRETGDEATQYLGSLSKLRTYYAGQTKITDRSLGVLRGLGTLEQITLSGCDSITDFGVSQLADLPKLAELNLSGMPKLSRKAFSTMPMRIRVNFEP